MSDHEIEALLQSLDGVDLDVLLAAGVDVSVDDDRTRLLAERLLRQTERKGESNMRPIRNKKRFIAILVAAILVVLAATGVAAARIFRLPVDYGKVNEALNLKLSDNFRRVVNEEEAQDGDIVVANKTVNVDGYTLTLEGIMDASRYRNISIDGEHLEGDVSGAYAVVTVTRDDGGMVYGYGEGEDEKTIHIIGAAPLIHGVKPNINTYGQMSLERETGVPAEYVEENVLYLFVDITDFLCFADKGLSLAVYGSMIYSAEEIGLDENGVPYFTEKARAPLAIFELPVDEKYADPDAQAALAAERPFAWAESLPWTFTPTE